MDKKKYMAMYDVRGIQNYVFKTNALKEIIGGSLIISDLIIEAFCNATNKLNGKHEIPTDKSDFEFFDDDSLDFEIMYYGGGNLVVLFRSKDIEDIKDIKDIKDIEYIKDIEDIYKINQKIARTIIEKSYGLSLASAVIEISGNDNYEEDYKRLTKEMDFVKDNMVEVSPVGALPIVVTDPISGYPLSKYENHRKVSYETKLKLDKCDEAIKEALRESYKDKNAKQFYQSLKINSFGTGEGESYIAIVHIDGNSMGSSITEVIKKAKTYEDAVKRMRMISSKIKKTFEIDGIHAIESSLNDFYKEAGLIDKDKMKLFRKVIAAGDDITFICNARIALRCVEKFISTISKECMYNDGTTVTANFSACAGIAIFHSHFPFYRGYKIAEELCDSAKKKAKANTVNGQVGNYVDFHLCYSGVINDLDVIRDKNYKVHNGTELLKRPYNLDKNGKYSISSFYKALNSFNKDLARSKAKELRDGYYESKDNMNETVNRIRSRDLDQLLPQDDFYEDADGKTYAKYFDALEFLDMHWEED